MYKLEDGLNDCAVIRTTFETLNLFPADDPICAEMQVIVDDARANLRRRCAAMRDNIGGIISLDRLLNKPRFQKYIAFMFVCYKADNPLFYT